MTEAAPAEARESPETLEIGPGVVCIDHDFRGSPGVIASYLLTDGDDLTLIEAGPSSTTDTLLARIRSLGFDPAQITRIIVTHIHLDHAGASGTLLQALPRAKVYVHPIGAPHLVDPSKLVASAQRIYGDLMKPLWGEIVPVPADRLVVLADGNVLTVGGRPLRALDTPGHAVHHFAFHDDSTGDLYAGDVAGVRLGAAPYVRPPTPPPELDLDAWRVSLARLRALRPRRLLLTHYGAFEDVDWHIDDLLSRLFQWAGWIGALLGTGADAAAITASLRSMEAAMLDRLAAEGSLSRHYDEAGNYRMSVDGFVRYFRKLKEKR